MNTRTILALGITLGATCQAVANINVELRPATQTVPVDSTVFIEMFLVSDSGSSQLMASAEIILTWDQTRLQLEQANNIPGLMGFPAFPGFLPLNEADPPADGNAMYIALAFGGVPVEATPAGTLLTTLQFKALLETTGTPVGIPASFVDPPGTTVVWDGTIPNFPVTGTLTGAIVIIEGPGAVCGDTGTGNCCEANGTPYCNDAACCDAICQIDPTCCTLEWDALCVGLAENEPLCGCVDCGDVGTGDCCEANGTPYCDDAACCVAVCLIDPSCCDEEWDALCAGLAQDNCTIICPVTGACCFPDGSCLDGLTLDTCMAMPGGQFQGMGSECLGSNSLIIVWGVDDRSSADSQLFVLNITTADLDLVGPLHDDADIEGMTFFGTQVAGVTGTDDDDDDDDDDDSPFLVGMDFITGALTPIAPVNLGSGDSEVTGMATDGNGVQWAFVEDLGLGTIDLAGTFTLVIPSKKDIEGLAAALDGETLWGITDGGTIYEIDVSAGTVIAIDNVGGEFADDDIENLELFSSTELAFFTEDGDDLEFSIYNIETGQLTTTVLRNLALEDVETFVFATISSCPTQLAQGCGTALSGDCCSENSTAGCLDADCCGIVCEMDPYCCDVRWDAICVNGADVACVELCACADPVVVVHAEVAINTVGGDGLNYRFDTPGNAKTAPGRRTFGAISSPGRNDDPPSSLAQGSGNICSLLVSWEGFSATGCDLIYDAVVQMNGQAIPVTNGQFFDVDCLGLNAPAGDVVGFGHEAGGVGSPPPATCLLIVTVQDEDGNQATDVLDLCEICEAANGTNGNTPPKGSAPGGSSISGDLDTPSQE